jgi:hypothetical protein
MADAKISQLPAATLPLSGAEYIPAAQAGRTVGVTAAALATYISAFKQQVTVQYGGMLNPIMFGPLSSNTSYGVISFNNSLGSPLGLVGGGTGDASLYLYTPSSVGNIVFRPNSGLQGTYTFAPTSALFSGVSVYVTNGNVGIGTGAPDSPLTVNASGGAWAGTLTPGTNIHLIGPAAAAGIRITMDAFTSAANYAGRRAEGNAAAPTATGPGAVMSLFSAFGYLTADWAPAASGQIRFTSNEAGVFTNTAQGTYLSFHTTPVGSAGMAEHMRVWGSGGVFIGSTGITDPGANNLLVQGTVISSNITSLMNKVDELQARLSETVARLNALERATDGLV